MMVVILATATNCSEDEFFELERPPQNPWTTIEDLERAPIGAYGVLFGSRGWVQAWPNYAVIITSLGDDIAWVNDPQWGYLRNTEAGTDLSDRNMYLLYRGISAANVALDFIAENDGNPYLEASEDQIEHTLNRIIGELHFVRAFCYYMLQTTFGHAYVPGGPNSDPDIAIHTSFPTSTDEAVRPHVGTTQEVWDQILADFQKAKSLLPEKYDASLHDQSFEVRANKFAASGMLMRTHFQRGEYDAALQEADYIIDNNGGEYDLSEDPIEAFNKSGEAERGMETIWYLPYSDPSLYPPNHLSVLNATWNGQQCQWNETRMAHATINRLGWMDDPENSTSINVAARRDKRFTQLMRVRYPEEQARPDQEVDGRPEVSGITSIWPFKYYRGPLEDYTNVPMLRLAEVFLTRSIIRFMNGNLAGAAEDLNVVRRRAWNEGVGGDYEEITSGDITEDMIHDERVIEMFNEADRVNYLRGLKVDIPNGDRGAGTEPYTSDRFRIRIPESEFLYNDNIGLGG